MSDLRPDEPAIRNIAIATDFSPWSDRAMHHGLLVARSYRAAVHILHTVRQSEFSFVPEVFAQLHELADRDCEYLVSRLHASHSLDDLEYRCWNLQGEVSSVFEDFVRDQNIDLLVVGTRGRTGLSKLVLGSVAEEIFHSVSCPILSVGPWSRAAAHQVALKNILFTTDLSSQSLAAVPYVLAAARMWNAGVDVLHVSSPDSRDCEPRMRAYSNRLLAMWGDERSTRIRPHVLLGEPSSEVLDFASESKADLIVLGLDNHRSLYGGPLFSHAYGIVRQARCPVLSVRSGWPASDQTSTST